MPGLVLLVCIAGIILIPLAFHYINQPQMFFIPMKRVSILNRGWIAATTQATGRSAFQLYGSHFLQTLRGLTEIPVRGLYNPGRPILLTFDSALLFAGFAIVLARLLDPRYNILLLGLIGPIMAGTFSVEAPSAQRLLYSVPFLAAIISIPVIELRTLLARYMSTWKPIAFAILPLIVFGTAYSNLSFFFGEAMPGQRYSDRGAYLVRTLADFLNEQPVGTRALMVIPAPIGYHSLPSLDFLATKVNGDDIDWRGIDSESIQPGNSRTLFIFQRENFMWSEPLIQQFPQADAYEAQDIEGELLFLVLDVEIAEIALHE
ncbi:MAG: hypothetical protein P1P76_01490 [Anaerolineales bacterium]|nr:hypothetical protein [Anaerolineales bacterium]